MDKKLKQALLISTETPEIRIAQMRDGRLFDFFVDRGGRVLNNIFKGRIANVINGMDAAFIDIGLNRNALIYAGDITGVTTKSTAPPIGKLVKVGDELLVQIARPPVGTKGARVTTKLSLAGRFVVLTMYDDKTGVSKRIENDDDRSRLRRIAEKLRPLDHGLILRTEAEGASESVLTKDIQAVTALMQKIRLSAATAQAPCLIHREAGALGRIARDRFNESIDEVWIDTVEEYEAFRNLIDEIAPSLVDRIHLYEGAEPLFQKFGVLADIDLAQEHTIPLPRGGTLVIDETEALCAIDVNTGKFTGKTRLAETVLQTNLEAVEAAARQIRLRNLGGVIVIDFIDMERQKDRIQVLDALEAALKQDYNRTRIVQLSPSGLVEITRRRDSLSLRQLLKRPCSYCGGAGVIKSAATVAVEARRQVREFAREKTVSLEAGQSANELTTVSLHPESACAFLGPTSEYVLNLEKTTGAKVWLRAEPNFHQEAVVVEAFHPGEIEEGLPPAQLESNTTITVPVQIARFPHKEPQFVVWHSRLIMLDNIRDLPNLSGKTCQILITDVGRWYANGRIIDDAIAAPAN